MKRKPPAPDRTIDIFSGKTKEEERLEAERIRDGLDNLAETKEYVSLEESADRCRERAFEMQQWVSDNFGKPEAEDNQYRVSIKGGHFYLDATKNNKAGAYAYSGFMFPVEDLPKLASVIVQATRAYLQKTKK